MTEDNNVLSKPVKWQDAINQGALINHISPALSSEMIHEGKVIPIKYRGNESAYHNVLFDRDFVIYRLRDIVVLFGDSKQTLLSMIEEAYDLCIAEKTKELAIMYSELSKEQKQQLLAELQKSLK